MTQHEAFRRTVRVWLAGHGKTQAWLADQLGCHESMVSGFLNGRRSLPEDTKDAFTKLTGIALESTSAQAAR